MRVLERLQCGWAPGPGSPAPWSLVRRPPCPPSAPAVLVRVVIYPPFATYPRGRSWGVSQLVGYDSSIGSSTVGVARSAICSR